jgi:hypothetical protein
MDPARQTELANMLFPADLDWPLLDQRYLLVRRQEALPETYPPVYRKRAELSDSEDLARPKVSRAGAQRATD